MKLADLIAENDGVRPRVMWRCETSLGGCGDCHETEPADKNCACGGRIWKATLYDVSDLKLIDHELAGATKMSIYGTNRRVTEVVYDKLPDEELSKLEDALLAGLKRSPQLESFVSEYGEPCACKPGGMTFDVYPGICCDCRRRVYPGDDRWRAK